MTNTHNNAPVVDEFVAAASRQVGAVVMGVNVVAPPSTLDYDAIARGEKGVRMADAKIRFTETAIADITAGSTGEWTGGISVAKRLESGEITKADIAYVKEHLGSFFVRTKPGTVVRCIDERNEEGFDDSIGSMQTDELGPQIPGGTLAGAVSYRHTVSRRFKDLLEGKFSFGSDAKLFGQRSAEATEDGDDHFMAGDHCAVSPDGKLGCGAVDGIEDAHAKVNLQNIPTLYGITKTVMGDAFNEEHFADFISSAKFLGASQTYFADRLVAAHELEEEGHNSLPSLAGQHRAVLININRVRGSTLNVNRMNAAMLRDTGKELQVFNYDLWYTESMAKKLFPESSEQQERYVHNRLLMAVATLMVLTDGTPEVSIRQPEAA